MQPPPTDQTASATVVTARQDGFTLLELSIVLVIIGLIVGGILVGQDLIKAAEIRATVGQIEKYNSAVNAFRSKYSAMPGDMPQGSAGSFGLLQLTASPTTGAGDGNSLLEGGAAASTAALGETLAFWRHLSDTSLIDGAFGSNGNSAIDASTGQATGNVANVSQSLPATRTTPALSIIVYSADGFNYYQMLPIAGITAAGGVYTYGATGLTPIQSLNMDNKLDDGMPNSGVVVARNVSSVNTAATFNAVATANNCTIGNGSATDTYNLTMYTGGTDPSCSLRFRFN